MKRSTVSLVVLALAVTLSLAVAGFSGTAAAEQDLTVTTVNVTPSEPAPGDRVRFTTTINNLQSSNETVQITDVYVREVGGNELARVEDLGSIAVGSSMTVPMSFSFDSLGEKDLRVHVVARDSEGYQRFQYPVQVTVTESSDVQLAINAEDFVAGDQTNVNVTVANGGDTPISNVVLRLGSDGTVENPRRVSGTIPANTDREYSFQATFDEAGSGTIGASLNYTMSGGITRTVEESVEVEVDQAETTTEGRIQLTGIETTMSGGTLTIEGDASNVGTTDARSVLVSVQEADGVTPVQPTKEYFIGTVQGSEFGTFQLTANVDSSVSSVPVLVEWTVDDERQSEVVQVAVDRSGGSVEGSQQQAGQPGGNGPGGGPPGGPFSALGNIDFGFLGLVLVAVIGTPAVAYYLWKRR